jgi:hypothetical protein
VIKVTFTDEIEIITSTEHLYQWDVGQVLEIGGLTNIGTPMVHFGVKGDTTGYAVQSQIVNDKLRCGIPDIVLQSGKQITAYVYVLAGASKYTDRVILIPVVERNKPNNYETVNMADVTETQSFFDDVVDRIEVLEARMNTFTSLPEGSTSAYAEIIDARIGADGKTYPNLGGAIRGQVSELKNDVDELSLPIESVWDGYYEPGFIRWDYGTVSTNASYGCSGYIPIISGEKYALHNFSTVHFAFYNTAKVFSKLTETNDLKTLDGFETYAGYHIFVAPITGYIRLSGGVTGLADGDYNVFKISSKEDLDIFDDVVKQGGFPNGRQVNCYKDVKRVSAILNKSKTNGVSVSKTQMSGLSLLEMTDTFDELGGYTIQAKANITHLSEFTVGKGRGVYYGGSVTISGNNININYYNTLQASYQHDLTIKDYISVTIKTSIKTTRATIYIDTNGGSFVLNDVVFDVRNGKPFIRTGETSEIDNVKLSYYAKEWRKKIWVFGDSYLNLCSSERWGSYLKLRGFDDNVMFNGYPGRNSADGLKAFKSTVKLAHPETIVWCLGMNDVDNGAVNTSWNTALETVKKYCNSYGIELVLSTTPNTPTRDNSFKNEVVRNSGYDYIDFAKSVGAEYDNVWYDGMLADDGVHSTEQGALALFTQAIIDLPKLCDFDY